MICNIHVCTIVGNPRSVETDRGFPMMHMYMYMEYNYPDLLYMIQKQMTHNTSYNYKWLTIDEM